MLMEAPFEPHNVTSQGTHTFEHRPLSLLFIGKHPSSLYKIIEKPTLKNREREICTMIGDLNKIMRFTRLISVRSQETQAKRVFRQLEEGTKTSPEGGDSMLRFLTLVHA